ncbi:MAG: hypothetical protein K2W96_26680 [Gemmataceae bacterium]|nr:hypothetical protein [Gemmataceae bacterium]
MAKDIDEVYRQERPDREEPAKPTGPKWGSQDIRRSIAAMARTFVRESHYLWGTAGNRPGELGPIPDGNPGGNKLDTCSLLPATLDDKGTERVPKKHLAVLAGMQERAEGYNVCAGKSKMHSGNPTKDDEAEYFREARAAQAKGIPQWQWKGLKRLVPLHPRRAFHSGNPLEAGAVIWGESCLNKRHFDCVGLVNYCYAEHTRDIGGKGGKPIPWGVEIVQYMDGRAGTVAVDKSNLAGLMEGDILGQYDKGKWHHIALLCKRDGLWCVVQAADTDLGLNDNGKYEPGKWTKVVRMLDTQLVPRRKKLKDGNGN